MSYYYPYESSKAQRNATIGYSKSTLSLLPSLISNNGNKPPAPALVSGNVKPPAPPPPLMTQQQAQLNSLTCNLDELKLSSVQSSASLAPSNSRIPLSTPNSILSKKSKVLCCD